MAGNNDTPAPPQFYANMELVEDAIKYETRRRTYAVLTSNIYVRTVYQQRKIRTKKYEGTFRDIHPANVGLEELPAPPYLAGNNLVELNPEGLTVGGGIGQWHMIDVQYVKVLTEPLSRRYTVTWESYATGWQTVEQESDSM